MSIRLIQSGLLSAMAALLIACGGGGGGGGGNASAPPPPPSLSGIAAIGAAMANAKVTLKDSKGNTASTYADNGGNFSFSNVGGFTPPIMLRASGTVNNQPYTLHSLLTSVPSTGNINLNVTPATEALTAQTLGGTPASAFDVAQFSSADPVKLQAAKAKLMAALQDTLLALGLDTDAVDLMTSKFAANNQGFDKLLDLVDISANTRGEITLKDKRSTNPTPSVSFSDSSVTVPTITVTVDDKTPLITTGIQEPINKLITAFNNKSKIDQTYFDEKFLYQGSNKGLFNTYLSENPELTSNDYVINGKYKIKKCVQTEDKKDVCYVGLQVITQSSNIVIKVIDMGVIQVTSGTWKLYGDQAPFVFSYMPVYVNFELSNVMNEGGGVFLNFSGKACDLCKETVFSKATIDTSYDGGKTYSSRFNYLINSNDDTIYSDGGIGSSKNNKSISDTDAQAFNEANLSGKLKIKITAYSSNSQPKIWYPPTYPLLFSSGAEVKDFINQNSWGIGQGLGTRNVSFTGNKILGVLAFFKHPRFFDSLLGVYKPSELTGNRITPLDTTNICTSFEYKSKYLFGSMTCETFFQSVNIPAAGLMSIDDKGRAIIYAKAVRI